jgi:hypothetical protein
MLAKGRSSYITIILIIQLLIQVGAITTGYLINDVTGIIIGYTMVGWLMYPVNSFLANKLKIWQPIIDIPAIILAILLASLYARFFISFV